MRKIKKVISLMIMCSVLTLCFSNVVFAAQYIYYGGGLKNPEVEVVDRLGGNTFGYSVSRWNSTSTPVKITEIAGLILENNYVTSGQWDDTWYGMYTPTKQQYIFWGRAVKFKIELNRTNLVGESDTFWRSVLVHELGHAFCLDDNPSSGNSSIMNYDRNRNYLTWPTSNDIAGVNNAYK